MASMPAVEKPPRVGDPRKQQLRLRRFLFASMFSVLYLIVLGIFHTQGKIDRATLLQATGIVFGLIIGFTVLFRSGLNLRFPDPSLTGGGRGVSRGPFFFSRTPM